MGMPRFTAENTRLGTNGADQRVPRYGAGARGAYASSAERAYFGRPSRSGGAMRRCAGKFAGCPRRVPQTGELLTVALSRKAARHHGWAPVLPLLRRETMRSLK